MTSVKRVQIDFHMIWHIFRLLSFFDVGEAGVIGEDGASSGASATAGSFGVTDDLDRMNSPVASSIEGRPSSPGDFGDGIVVNQLPGNLREVEDAYRSRELFWTADLPDIKRSNFGLNFP